MNAEDKPLERPEQTGALDAKVNIKRERMTRIVGTTTEHGQWNTILEFRRRG